MQRRSSVLLAVFLFAAPAVTTSASQTDRPLVGLALGGGAARGIAHIGILEWLEEHRVPVDFVAGTSMGGLVGGAYASGMSTQEIRDLMRDMDWDLVFLADSPFKYKNFRRKEDARLYPSQIELGLKGGLRLPTGMNSGQAIGLSLDRIAARYGEMDSFDDLPIPFRSIAVDLRTRSEVVLGSGSLALALRATMAIPGVFTPVAWGERLLVDGGTLNNVPADVARSLGANVVVAVNVGSGAEAPPEPRNMFDVIGQTVDVMMNAGVDRALDFADVVVTPELRGLTGTDWRKSDAIADRGYVAAESMKAELLDYAVDEASYRAWQEKRLLRRRDASPTIAFVRVEGLSEDRASRIRSRVEGELVGKPFDPDAVDREMLLLAGTDRFSVLRYGLDQTEAGTGLVVYGEVKPYGPPFLHPAVDLQNIDANNFAMNLRGRLVFFDTLVSDSEIRIDAVVGTGLLAGVELHRHLGGTPLFVAPRAYWSRRSLNTFDGESRILAEYRETAALAGLDVGLELGSRSQLRFGYDVADVDIGLRIGQPSLPEAQGTNRFVSLRFTFDGQTSPLIPTRGLYLWSRAAHYFDTPDLFLGELELPGPQDYYQAEFLLSAFHSTGGDHRLFVGGGGGTSFGEPSGYNEFELGGPQRLGAFNQGALRADNYLLGQGGALFRVMRLPDMLGGNGYVGGWLEAGSAFDAWDEVDVQWHASGGVVLETFLGPVFLGGSVSLNDGGGRFYVSLGPFLHQQARVLR